MQRDVKANPIGWSHKIYALKHFWSIRILIWPLESVVVVAMVTQHWNVKKVKMLKSDCIFYPPKTYRYFDVSIDQIGQPWPFTQFISKGGTLVGFRRWCNWRSTWRSSDCIRQFKGLAKTKYPINLILIFSRSNPRSKPPGTPILSFLSQISPWTKIFNFFTRMSKFGIWQALFENHRAQFIKVKFETKNKTKKSQSGGSVDL